MPACGEASTNRICVLGEADIDKQNREIIPVQLASKSDARGAGTNYAYSSGKGRYRSSIGYV